MLPPGTNGSTVFAIAVIAEETSERVLDVGVIAALTAEAMLVASLVSVETKVLI